MGPNTSVTVDRELAQSLKFLATTSNEEFQKAMLGLQMRGVAHGIPENFESGSVSDGTAKQAVDLSEMIAGQGRSFQIVAKNYELASEIIRCASLLLDMKHVPEEDRNRIVRTMHEVISEGLTAMNLEKLYKATESARLSSN